MKVFLLGHRGMLGSAVYKYFSSIQNCKVKTTNLRWDEENFKQELRNFKGDAIVNCIGSIPQRGEEFNINFELPIWLDKNSNCSIVHPGTDCEMDDDKYGVSKRKASKYLEEEGTKTKIIKTSIIGPELNTQCSLLEWFLNTTDTEVKGYTHHMWNGITTLQWAKICWDLLNNFEGFPGVTIPATKCISKFTLLNHIKKVYKKDVAIIKSDKVKADKCLVGNLKVPFIQDQLIELQKFGS